MSRPFSSARTKVRGAAAAAAIGVRNVPREFRGQVERSVENASAANGKRRPRRRPRT